MSSPDNRTELFPHSNKIILVTGNPQADEVLVKLLQEKGFEVGVVKVELPQNPLELAQLPEILTAANRHTGANTVGFYIHSTPPQHID
ncbi:hypothetical protein M1563_05050 [Patescibacteria group bacterium]|nr:hypothetical protein [Patescibacteria group bacterium]MCL5409433.1 hypothetical protein [Patescibacteria group bacterium]